MDKHEQKREEAGQAFRAVLGALEPGTVYTGANSRLRRSPKAKDALAEFQMIDRVCERIEDVVHSVWQEIEAEIKDEYGS